MGAVISTTSIVRTSMVHGRTSMVNSRTSIVRTSMVPTRTSIVRTSMVPKASRERRTERRTEKARAETVLERTSQTRLKLLRKVITRRDQLRRSVMRSGKNSPMNMTLKKRASPETTSTPSWPTRSSRLTREAKSTTMTSRSLPTENSQIASPRKTLKATCSKLSITLRTKTSQPRSKMADNSARTLRRAKAAVTIKKEAKAPRKERRETKATRDQLRRSLTMSTKADPTNSRKLPEKISMTSLPTK